MSQGAISLLPPTTELESHSVLKRLAPAHRYLAELKGMASTIPNEHILINTLALQEAKDSSEIENVITTHDDLYKADLFAEYKDGNYTMNAEKGFVWDASLVPYVEIDKGYTPKIDHPEPKNYQTVIFHK